MTDLPPAPADPADLSDQALARAVRRNGPDDDPVRAAEELIARHWEAVFGYALECTATPAAAGRLAAAAFARALHQARCGTGPGAAWRPELLLLAGRLAEQWRTAGRVAELAADAGQPPAERPRPLALHAFRAVPETARGLLWHCVVQREQPAGTALLLGIEPGEAQAQLTWARELFRERCLRTHTGTLRDEQCRRYSGLLDVATRTPGALRSEDLRSHLAACEDCRSAADRLSVHGPQWPAALVRDLLGDPGVRCFTPGRPAEPEPLPTPAPVPAAAAAAAGAGVRPHHGTARAPRRRPGPAGRGGRGGVAAVLIGLAAAVVVAATLRVTGAGADPRGGTVSATSGLTATGAPPTRAASTAPAGTLLPEPAPGTFRTELRNAATGGCLDVRGGSAQAGADVVVVRCNGSATQQWAYGADALLRNLGDPRLCLDSRGDPSLGAGLGPCPVAGEDGRLRYELTVQGLLVPRIAPTLALTPLTRADGSGAVLKVRTGAAEQRWLARPGTAVADAPARAAADGRVRPSQR
ncbi:ricin-type beta-trefoil lectin domain protein [Peterkaempfera sp. SMS 1(5)a]|uniref:ricin-type beta-trefoil lectin domain protein n=1 Tax=Peterkaempfera podocarpi TaxID=3232308 RepID=UPI00366B3033